MAKRNAGAKPEIITRESLPKIRETKTEVQILCPFCTIPHPISIGKKSACGTDIRVMAVQVVVPVRTVHRYGLKCIKCGESTGEMTPFNDGYVHLQDCRPEMPLMAQAPSQFSWLAAQVYRLPWRMRGWVEKYTGPVKQVDEIDPQGVETGKTLGFIFYKGV